MLRRREYETHINGLFRKKKFENEISKEKVVTYE